MKFLIKISIFTFLCFNAAKCLELGKLTIGISGDQNVIQLKGNNNLRTDASLKATFFRTSVMNAHLNGSKAADISFTRDKAEEKTRAVVEEVLNDNQISHYSINWINPNSTEELCIDLDGNQQWYSTYEEKIQRWPLDKSAHFNTVAFITNDFFQRIS